VRASKRRHGAHLAAEAAAAFVASVALFLLAAAIPIRHHAVLIVLLGGIYVYVIVVAGKRLGPLYAVPLAIAGGLAFDSFYIPPTREFGADDWQNWLVIAIYISMGVLVGALAAASQHRAEVSEAARAELADEQAALRRVATLVARESPSEEVFAKVAEEVALLLRVETALMLRYAPGGTATIVASWGGSPEAFAIGRSVSLQGDTVTAGVLRTGRPARIDDYATATGPVAATMRELGVNSTVGAPIVVAGQLWGVVVVGSRRAEPMEADTESRIEEFAELVAMAVSNAQARSDLAASRTRIVTATDEMRRRFERDLHDGTQQRLVSLALQLRTVEATVPPEATELRAQLGSAVEGLAGAVEDLREISRGIHPAVLSKGGLGPALKVLARRSPVPVRLDLGAIERLPQALETAAYYVVSEALANATKHATASVVEVDLGVRDGRLHLSIRDDGVGGADPSDGSGLRGLIDRVEALGGMIAVTSPSGQGTSIVLELPIGQQGF
jgi:signal transduction histidine kinase